MLHMSIDVKDLFYLLYTVQKLPLEISLLNKNIALHYIDYLVFLRIYLNKKCQEE